MSWNWTTKLFPPHPRISVCVLKVKRLAAVETNFQSPSTSQVYCKQICSFSEIAMPSGLNPDLEGQLNQLQKGQPSRILEPSLTCQVARGKKPACQCRRHRRHGFNPWVRKIPWRRAWWLTPVFLPGGSHGQRSLAGYSPWGRKEWDLTEATECPCMQTSEPEDHQIPF